MAELLVGIAILIVVVSVLADSRWLRDKRARKRPAAPIPGTPTGLTIIAIFVPAHRSNAELLADQIHTLLSSELGSFKDFRGTSRYFPRDQELTAQNFIDVRVVREPQTGYEKVWVYLGSDMAACWQQVVPDEIQEQCQLWDSPLDWANR